MHVGLNFCSRSVKSQTNPRPSRDRCRPELHRNGKLTRRDSFASDLASCPAIVKHADANMDIVGSKALCKLLQSTPSLVFVGDFSHGSQ